MRHPTLALIGLGVIGLLCVLMLRGALTLEVAAQRALLTVVLLAAVDRVAMPLGRAMLATGRVAPRPAEDGFADREFDDDEGSGN